MVSTDGTPFDDLELNVYRGNENGPPLIFIHGVLRCWQDFRPLFPFLGFDWTCYSVDQRGHGESERASGFYRVIDYLGDIIQFVESQFDEPVVLYGHSLGGMVVAGVAAELGDRVAGIIMEDPPFETMGARIEQSSLHSYFRGVRQVRNQHHTVEDIASALGEILVTDPQTSHSILLREMRDEASLLFSAKCLAKVDPTVLDPIVESRWLEDFDYIKVTGNIDCPALLIQADPLAGGMLIDRDVIAMKKAKPNLFHLKIAGGGHLLHWTHREQVEAAVTQFLTTP